MSCVPLLVEVCGHREPCDSMNELATKIAAVLVPLLNRGTDLETTEPSGPQAGTRSDLRSPFRVLQLCLQTR